MMHQPTRGPRPHKIDPTLLLAFLLPVFAWAPLLHPGYFVFRSGFLPIFNLADRLANLVDFAWMPTVGTDYSLLTGDGPLPYLLGALPSVLGAGPMDSVKWVFALSLVAASGGAYAWSRTRLQSGWSALVAAAVYVFNPISLHLVYTDGAFAQALFFALMPWALRTADAVASRRRWAIPVLALLVAATFWTHVGLALVFTLLLVAYLLVHRQVARLPVQDFALAVAGLAGGLLVAGLGLLPAVLRHGAGATIWPASTMLVLVLPWLALLAAWIATRLAAMLPSAQVGDCPVLFAGLIGLALLLVYQDIQPVASTAAIPSAPVAIFGENEIALLSVQTEGAPGPNRAVAVEVEWQSLRSLTRDYTVFFHVIASDGQRYGQLDTMPQDGQLPTTHWQPGVVVRDRYEAQLSPAAPNGSGYQYWLGWYLGETLDRLNVRHDATNAPDDKYVIHP